MIKVLQENINALRKAETRDEYIEICKNILDIYYSEPTPEIEDYGFVLDDLNITTVGDYLEYMFGKYQKIAHKVTPGELKDLTDSLQSIDLRDKYLFVVDSPYEEFYGFSSKEKVADNLQSWLDDYKYYLEHQ